MVFFNKKAGLVIAMAAASISAVIAEDHESPHNDDDYDETGFLISVGAQPSPNEVQQIRIQPSQGAANISGSVSFSLNGEMTPPLMLPFTSYDLHNALYSLPNNNNMSWYIEVQTIISNPQEMLWEVKFDKAWGNVANIVCDSVDIDCSVNTISDGGNPPHGDLFFSFPGGASFTVDYNATQYDIEMHLNNLGFTDPNKPARVEKWMMHTFFNDGREMTHSYRVYGFPHVPMMEAQGNFEVLYVDWAGRGLHLKTVSTVYPMATPSDVQVSSAGKVMITSGNMIQVFGEYDHEMNQGYFSLELEIMGCASGSIADRFIVCAPHNGSTIDIYESMNFQPFVQIPFQSESPPLDVEIFAMPGMHYASRVVVVTEMDVTIMTWGPGQGFQDMPHVQTVPLGPDGFTGGLHVNEQYAAVTTSQNVMLLGLHENITVDTFPGTFGQVVVTEGGYRVFAASPADVGIQGMTVVLFEHGPNGEWMNKGPIEIPPEVMMNAAPRAKLLAGKDFIVLGDVVISEEHDDENNMTRWIPLDKIREFGFESDGLSGIYHGEHDEGAPATVVASGIDLLSGGKIIYIFRPEYDHKDDFQGRWTWACNCDPTRSYYDCLDECHRARGRWGWTCEDDRFKSIHDLSDSEREMMYQMCWV